MCEKFIDMGCPVYVFPNNSLAIEPILKDLKISNFFHPYK